jgi:ectoine hydroxylase
MPNMLTAAQTAEFNDKGFTYARGLFAPDEVKLLTEAMEKDPAVRSSILDRRDVRAARPA